MDRVYASTMTGSVPAIDTRFHSSTSSRGGSAASSPGPAMSVSLTSACSSQRPMLPPLAQHLPGMLGLSAPAQVTAPQLPPAVLPLSAPAGKLAMPVQPTLQILGATGGVASACDEDETLSRQPVRQMYGSDGRLYIEYQPDTNVVFLPVSLPVDRVVRGVVRVPRRRKAAGRTAAHEWAKPHNAFIRYRSWKLEAIKRLYPNANQIDLSRIAAEHWRNEDPQIKDRFQQQYRAELEIYHGRQKIQNMAAEHNARLYHPEPVPHHSPLAAPELPRRRSSSAPHGATKPHSVKHLVH